MTYEIKYCLNLGINLGNEKVRLHGKKILDYHWLSEKIKSWNPNKMIATIKPKLHTFVTKLIITPSCTKPGNHPLNNNNNKKKKKSNYL